MSKKHSFKFVYYFAEGEIPEAVYFSTNNITNAKKRWELSKDGEDVLLAIFEDGKIIWGSDIKTGYQLDAIH